MTITATGLAEVAKLTGAGQGGVKFGAVALGTSATAPTINDTQLGGELVGGGGDRKSGADVAVTAVTTVFPGDTARLIATWSFTNSFSINELGVFNAPTGGVMLLRQTFVAPLNVVLADTLQVTVDVQTEDQNPAGLTTLTNAGIIESTKLVFEDLTATNAGINAVALGLDDGTTLPLANTNTALGSEITAAQNFGLARGQETVAPSVSIVTVNVANDTTRVAASWTVAVGAAPFVAVNEAGLFDQTGQGQGILYARYTFANPLNLVPTDDFTMTFQIVNV